MKTQPSNLRKIIAQAGKDFVPYFYNVETGEQLIPDKEAKVLVLDTYNDFNSAVTDRETGTTLMVNKEVISKVILFENETLENVIYQGINLGGLFVRNVFGTVNRIDLPGSQTAGTFTQRDSYARIKAQELT